MTLREELSAGLGVNIPENGWDESFNQLDIKGQVTQRVLIELFLILAKRLETLENAQTPISLKSTNVDRRG